MSININGSTLIRSMEMSEIASQQISDTRIRNIPVRSSIEIEKADEISEEAAEEKSIEEGATKPEAIDETAVGKEPDLLRQDESVQISRGSSHSCDWDEHARESETISISLKN